MSHTRNKAQVPPSDVCFFMRSSTLEVSTQSSSVDRQFSTLTQSVEISSQYLTFMVVEYVSSHAHSWDDRSHLRHTVTQRRTNNTPITVITISPDRMTRREDEIDKILAFFSQHDISWWSFGIQDKDQPRLKARLVPVSTHVPVVRQQMLHGRLTASGTSKYMVCFNRTVASYKKLSNVFSSVNDNSPEGHEDDDDDDADLGVEVGVDLVVEVEVDLGVDDKADFEYEHEDENDDKVPLLVPLAPLVPLPPPNSPLQLAATSKLHQFQSSVQHHIEARQIERVVVLGRTSTFSTKQVSLDAQVGLLQHMLGDFEGDTRMLECNGVSAYEHDYLLEACKRDEKTLVLATSIDRACRNPAFIEDILGSLDVMTFIHCDTGANCRPLADEWLNTLDESDQQTWRPILERQLSHTTSVKTAGITFPYL
ncbi:hypothetical protein [Phaffia rhodozyma]|uniref:Uncharacterized protein n=1 Tax=Phaffia rhodozyma TaxID=264483 RepID=A0A0F7SEB6_PHARH|nr:hypothetical protein [Phaffia rhodozyma]